MQRIPTEEPDLELGDVSLLPSTSISAPSSPPLPSISFRQRCLRATIFISRHRQGLMLLLFLMVNIVLFAIDNKYLDIISLTLLSTAGFMLCLRAFMIARGLRLDGLDIYESRAAALGGSLTLREQMLLHQTMYGDSLWLPNVRSNSTHLRLSMMDRDFNANDYEVLLRLDEEVRARTFTGIPQSQINRLPTFTLKDEIKSKFKDVDTEQVKPTSPSSPSSLSSSSSSSSSTSSSSSLSSSTSSSSSLSSSSFSSSLSSSSLSSAPSLPSSTSSKTKISSSTTSSPDNTRKCAVCLDPQVPGQTLRSLPCLHNFHIDCIDPWLRIKPVCPICHIDVFLPSDRDS